LIQRNVESAGSSAQKSPCACGAFVVHAKIHDFAGSANPNGFGVLATDFRDLRVPEGHAIAAVTGTDHVLDFFFLGFCGLQSLCEGLFRRNDHIGAGVDQRATDDVLRFVDHHGFCLRGPDIDPCRVSHLSLLLRSLPFLPEPQLPAGGATPGLQRKRQSGFSSVPRSLRGGPSCPTQ
jgi:hypothetical protein